MSKTRRTVLPPPPHDAEVSARIDALPIDVAQAVVITEHEILGKDPSGKTDRCGLLNDRFEIFAVSIDGYKKALVCSFDRKSGPRGEAMIHGVVAERGKQAAALDLVLEHRAIVRKTWET